MRIALLTTALLLTFGAARVVTGAPAQKAKCIVSGKEIEVTEKTPKVQIQGKSHYFCCENCPKAFAKQPEKYVKELSGCPVLSGDIAAPNPAERAVINNGLWYVCCPGCVDGVDKNTIVLKSLADVVSGKPFKATTTSPRSEYKGQIYLFEGAGTKATFDKDPAKYAVLYGK